MRGCPSANGFDRTWMRKAKNMLPQDKDKLGERLSAYLDGELDAAEAAEVERMVAADPQAAAMLETLRRTVETVRALPRRSAPDGMLEDLTARIERAQLLDGASEKARADRGDRRSAWGLLASAAIVIFAVGGGFWAFNRMSESISGPEKQVAMRDKEASPVRPWEAEEAERAVARQRGGKGVHPSAEHAPKAEPGEGVDVGSGPKLDVAFRTRTEHLEAPSLAEEAAVSADVSARGRGRGAVAGEAEPVKDGLDKKAAHREGRVAAVPMQPAPPYGPRDSLEARLRSGVKRRDVLVHPFTNEAHHLYVSFANGQDRDDAQNRLIAFTTANNIPDLRKVLVRDTDPIPPSRKFVVVGQAHANFPETTQDRQFLVRLSPQELDALVDELGAAATQARYEKPPADPVTPKAFTGVTDIGPPHEAKSAERGRDRVPALRRAISGRRGVPRVPTGAVGPADTSADGLEGQPARAAPPAAETREGTAGQPGAAEDIITVVINLLVLPDEERGDEPDPTPSAEPAATQPTTDQPATARQGAALELPEDP